MSKLISQKADEPARTTPGGEKDAGHLTSTSNPLEGLSRTPSSHSSDDARSKTRTVSLFAVAGCVSTLDKLHLSSSCK